MFHILKIFLIFFISVLILKSEDPGKNLPIKLKYADKMEEFPSPDGSVRQFVGNVSFQQGNVNVKCDRAIQYLNQNRAELTGNVVFTQDDLILKSAKINYDGNSGVAVSNTRVDITDRKTDITANRGIYYSRTLMVDLFDNVTIKDDSVRISADKIRYDRTTHVSFANGNVAVEDDSSLTTCSVLEHNRDTRDSYAQGNVIIRGKYNEAILTGDTLSNFPGIQYSQAKGHPVLFQIDSVRFTYKNTDSSEVWFETRYRFDTLSMSSDIMESRSEYGRQQYVFTGNVEIVRHNVNAKSGRAIYYKANDIITMDSTPILWLDSTQLYADSIVVGIVRKKLEIVKGYGSSILLMKDTLSDDRINQLAGDFINIRISEDTVRFINAIGNSKSLYYMLSQESADGCDRKSADSIMIEFEKSEIAYIYWLGAVNAEYFPEIVVMDKVKDYYLPGFRWTSQKPTQKRLIVKK